MAALTGPRNTPQQAGTAQINLIALKVAANAVIKKGGIVALNATGYAVPASTATTLTAVGRAEQDCDNTGGADGAKTIEGRFGVFKYVSATAGDAVTQAHLLKTLYLVDDQTVASVSTGRSIAGLCMGVESDGVWVQFRP